MPVLYDIILIGPTFV